ncbi:MAG: site-specific DNA-methyltransferase [Paludibacteraceae bacterium]|nr:site-specific DNA-methyltransferase [Paludibacteraceae bacterium]
MAKCFFYNEDCLANMGRMASKNFKVDLVITSPPYMTSRSKVKTQKALDTYNRRYDICLDDMDENEYREWTINIFNKLDKVLSKDGVVLYNISYGSENPNAMWLLPEAIINNTPFMISDCIVWKKGSALPNNVGNKMTRLTEFVFIISRKSDFATYRINKKVKSVREDTGQKYYENMSNFIQAPNNDGSCDLNKATYSSKLCEELLFRFANENSIVFDPFMGTGTTAIACEKFCPSDTMMCIGCELSPNQVEFSKKRLAAFREGKDMRQFTRELKREKKPNANDTVHQIPSGEGGENTGVPSQT